MFVEDLSVFFVSSDFAVTATLDGVSVLGLFDNGYLQAFDGIATSGTTFTLPTAQTVSATSASVLVVNGTTYRVRSVQPDGSGVSVLLLERQ